MVPGWLDAIEEEVLSCLRTGGTMSARELAGALGIPEGSAVYYIHLLASSGRLSIEGVAAASRRDATPLRASAIRGERAGETEEEHGVLAGGSLG
ncbi:MAG: hypothetical protein A2X51_13425 [Candidatus Rokubacteria bacterium GWC2_70_24]|nr:MAG: hypothetical protein A2X53_11935 [Candidatus Rokubacteria bacterium GWA2_70_23]OGK90885.1 MAG: hypothetical protein A2X51_13425 [Candidatus Rokubacteria bacterium GWC2_70_24]HAM60121.1 hypothetical protein [Candidatus Rokubacteria bacterium]